MLERITDYVNQNTGELSAETVKSHVVGQLAVIDQLDKNASEKLWEALAVSSSNKKYEIFTGRFEEVLRKGLYKEGEEGKTKSDSGAGKK